MAYKRPPAHCGPVPPRPTPPQYPPMPPGPAFPGTPAGDAHEAWATEVHRLGREYAAELERWKQIPGALPTVEEALAVEDEPFDPMTDPAVGLENSPGVTVTQPGGGIHYTTDRGTA